MIEEAVEHTPLEAEFARQIDRLTEEMKRMDKRLPRSLAQQMDAIGSLAHKIDFSKNDIIL